MSCDNFDGDRHHNDRTIIIPSPTAPWLRPATSPITETLSSDGTLVLSIDTHYLSSNVTKIINSVNTPYVIVVPNGNYQRQIIRIYGDPSYVKNQTLAPFSITGTFVGFTSLSIDSVHFSAVLEWVIGNDGNGAWNLIGGNALAVA